MNCNQREKPCGSCPFSKKSKPGALGGSNITVYLGQLCGPFVLPCHCQKGYQGNDTPIEAEQCAGAAILRRATGIYQHMPKGILILPEGDPDAFGSVTEFIEHHLPDASPVKVEAMIALMPEFLSDELRKAQAKGRVYPI